jgi:hypothetical protein
MCVQKCEEILDGWMDGWKEVEQTDRQTEGGLEERRYTYNSLALEIYITGINHVIQDFLKQRPLTNVRGILCNTTFHT